MCGHNFESILHTTKPSGGKMLFQLKFPFFMIALRGKPSSTHKKLSGTRREEIDNFFFLFAANHCTTKHSKNEHLRKKQKKVKKTSIEGGRAGKIITLQSVVGARTFACILSGGLMMKFEIMKVLDECEGKEQRQRGRRKLKDLKRWTVSPESLFWFGFSECSLIEKMWERCVTENCKKLFSPFFKSDSMKLITSASKKSRFHSSSHIRLQGFESTQEGGGEQAVAGNDKSPFRKKAEFTIPSMGGMRKLCRDFASIVVVNVETTTMDTHTGLSGQL